MLDQNRASTYKGAGALDKPASLYPSYSTIRKNLKKSSSYWLHFLCLALTVLVLAACDNGQTTTRPQTPASVTLPLGIPAQALNAPITGAVPDSQIMHINVSFQLDPTTLKQFDQSRIAKTGQPTSVADIAGKLGISDTDYQKIKTFFGVKDATAQLSQSHTSMTVDIQAGSLAKLLQTKFVLHSLNGRIYYTPDPQHMPQVPQSIASKLQAVTGLDNYTPSPRGSIHFTGQQAAQSKAQGFQFCPLTFPTMAGRNQIAHAYGFDRFWQRGWSGQGMTVNLVEIDGANQDDLNAYFSCVNYKGKVTYTTVGNHAPAPEGETTLDIDMIAGLVPGANIHDYQTDVSTATDGGWQNLLDTFQRIIDDYSNNTNSMQVVSVSLGAPESELTSALGAAFNQRLQILTQVEHMTVLVSSGDCAAFTGGVYGQLDVSYPASSPYATAVGGTVLRADLDGNRNSEVVWSDSTNKQQCGNSWGSGGGLSKFFAQPSWQTGIPGLSNQYSTGKRQLPDIAAAAYNLPVFYQGLWQPVGGTSGAAPIWAAAMLITNQGLAATRDAYAYGPDIFYFVAEHAGNMHPYYDITTGENLYYRAGPGWDYASGLGVPYLPDFLAVEQANT